MSSLFGQVWLWSLLSFVAGVALTWLVLVRPAKRELEDLEERLLVSPRPTPSDPPPPAPMAEPRDDFDKWRVGASRSPADDVLTPEAVRFDRAEPPRYDVSNMKLDKRDELLEELDDEHRPLSDFEERHDFPELEADRPRSLFERLAPENEGVRASKETPEPRSQRYDEPELPVEETHLMPVVPVAQPAPPGEEPTAPPEVEAFQPREVWREEPVREVYDQDEVKDGHEEDDEPERRGNEETALIPATALAQAIAEVDRQERPEEPDEPAQVWPEHDLTGHFAPVNVESARGEPDEPGAQTEVMKAVVDPAPVEQAVATPKPDAVREPEPFEPSPHEAESSEPEQPPVGAKKDEPAPPRSLFEPLVTQEEELESEQSRPTPPAPPANDQPFVPTLSPELLASGGGNGTPTPSAGLPQRPTRTPGASRPSSPPPLSSPQPIKPPPPRQVRPRPVGFSPSTGGRPADNTTRYQGQQEGFNPRSPFGPGSVLPKSDGLAPAPEFQVKATLTGRRYFTAESANFRETRADVWFRTTVDAEKAGFHQAP